jgi:hypothetical protein
MKIPGAATSSYLCPLRRSSMLGSNIEYLGPHFPLFVRSKKENRNIKSGNNKTINHV